MKTEIIDLPWNSFAIGHNQPQGRRGEQAPPRYPATRSGDRCTWGISLPLRGGKWVMMDTRWRSCSKCGEASLSASCGCPTSTICRSLAWGVSKFESIRTVSINADTVPVRADAGPHGDPPVHRLALVLAPRDPALPSPASSVNRGSRGNADGDPLAVTPSDSGPGIVPGQAPWGGVKSTSSRPNESPRFSRLSLITLICFIDMDFQSCCCFCSSASFP